MLFSINMQIVSVMSAPLHSHATDEKTEAPEKLKSLLKDISLVSEEPGLSPTAPLASCVCCLDAS